MRWAREHGRGEPVRCFDAEEYDEGDDAFDALFDGGSGQGRGPARNLPPLSEEATGKKRMS